MRAVLHACFLLLTWYRNTCFRNKLVGVATVLLLIGGINPWANAQKVAVQPSAVQPSAVQPYIAWVKHYATENGLPHREVNAIFQDREGFMWFGTKFGLCRFDGKNFTTFNKDRNGLAFDDIHAIAQDADGNLWLKGLVDKSQVMIFNPLTNKAVSFQEKFKRQLVSHSFNALEGVVGSTTTGTIFLTNYKPASLISYHPSTGLRTVPIPQFKMLGIFRVTAHNTVWAIADENSIVELTADGRVLHQFLHNENKDIVSWCFGMRNVGIEFFYRVDNSTKPERRKFYSIDEAGHRQEWPFSLAESMNRYTGPVCYPINRTGTLWDGINLRDSANRVLLSISEQTSGEAIENRSFYCDRNGWLWLGTSFGIYLVKLTQNHFRRLLYQESSKGEQHAAVRGITVLDDQVYANLEKVGLFRLPRQRISAKKVYSNRVFTYGLTQDKHGKLYLGDGNQLVYYDPLTGNNSAVPIADGSTIWAMHPVSAEQWLIGTQKGLTLFDARNRQIKPFTQYNQFTELEQSHVLYIAPDRQGKLWICSGTGFYSFDSVKGVTARYWSEGKGIYYLPADSYQHMYQDPGGVFWLATANSGLIRWQPERHQYQQFRRSEGLSNDNIYAVYPDRRGKLWLSSDYGIMRFDPVRLTTKAYFVQDGITHNEFNRIAHYQDKTGRIYFGGLNGITSFDPRDFETEIPPVSHPMRLVSFRQFDHKHQDLVDKTAALARTRSIVIQPGDQTAVLDFALLNYTDAEKNVYAYQFKGLDNTWTQQTESSLRIGNLPYGTYQLLIKGQAANGQWSANTLTFQVDVLRPFYQQLWFLVLIVLLLFAGIWGWFRWRIWNHQQEQLRLQAEIKQATSRIAADKEVIEQQARTLLKLNETRSRFFANISHEFRTPLTVVLGMAANIKEAVTGERATSIRHNSELIERNGRNLLRLINQILDLSRLEAGEMNLQPTCADLVRFTRYVSESFHTMAELKGIRLYFQSDDEALETDFDQDKLQDILTNLLANAIKFTPTGGRVTLRLTTNPPDYKPDSLSQYEAISPTRQPTDTWIFISVQDTGPGIDPANLPQIFNRFFQVDSTPVSGTEGTGIGLSLVRELIALMQGGLAVWSQPGMGAEFVVSFRRTCQAPLATLSMPKLVSHSADRIDTIESADEELSEKPVLLLVEDNDDVAAYIHTCVRTNYQVVRAENGQLGINLALERIPDLILSDVMMPQKDGFELCDTLKNDERTSHIPIVLLTARAAISDRIAGLKRRADAYLVKPFEREELLVVLGNLLQIRLTFQRYYGQVALGQGQSAELPSAQVNKPIEDQFLQNLQTEVEAQLEQESLSIEAICQHIGMSRTTLHRKMIALTGMPISRYLRTLQLRKAQELLSSSSLSISEVAYAVGFDDPKYFSRVFSEEMGVSPAKFRHSA